MLYSFSGKAYLTATLAPDCSFQAVLVSFCVFFAALTLLLSTTHRLSSSRSQGEGALQLFRQSVPYGYFDAWLSLPDSFCKFLYIFRGVDITT